MLKPSLLFTLLVLMALFQRAFAQDDHILLKSYMCPSSSSTDVQGVTCCTEELSLNRCQDLVQRFLMGPQLERVQAVKTKILAGLYPYKENPNCHWNALAFYFPHYFNVAIPMVDLETYRKTLDADFEEVDETRALPGDLVVYFEYEVSQREMIEVGGRPRLSWVNLAGEFIFHSAILLDEGFVFQKENLDSSIFSFGSLEKVREVYLDLANQTPSQRRAKIKYRFFRKL